MFMVQIVVMVSWVYTHLQTHILCIPFCMLKKKGDRYLKRADRMGRAGQHGARTNRMIPQPLGGTKNDISVSREELWATLDCGGLGNIEVEQVSILHRCPWQPAFHLEMVSGLKVNFFVDSWFFAPYLSFYSLESFLHCKNLILIALHNPSCQKTR